MNLARKILLLAAIPAAIVACSEKNQPLTPERASVRMNITGLVIQGPTHVTRWEQCSFVAVPSGGTAPYSYAWTVQNGSGTADENVWTGYTYTSSMTLTVTVTDALGATRTASKNVYGVASTIPCNTFA